MPFLTQLLFSVCIFLTNFISELAYIHVVFYKKSNQYDLFINNIDLCLLSHYVFCSDTRSRDYGNHFSEVTLSPTALIFYFYVSPAEKDQVSVLVITGNKT